MPAIGHQHLGSGAKSSITGLFEEPRRQISTYTAQEIATLQSRLEKQLGPEYLSSRAGPGGKKVHYVAAEKCIQLANSVFGFNGWSSQIIDFQVDFVDENPQTLKVSLGLSVVVRVTLKDGTFHEDIGYGHIENCKGKAVAFEKAKKEGTTDALKRALRNFGNVLGNCIYDKEYLKHVSKVKPFSPKWSEENLFRHGTFVYPHGLRHLPVAEKETLSPVEAETERKETPRTGSLQPSNTSEEFFEDEFGDFDEADFGVTDPESHPDEVVLSESTILGGSDVTAHHDSKPGKNDRKVITSESVPLTAKPIQAPLVAEIQPAQRQQIPQAPQTPETPETPTNEHSKNLSNGFAARQEVSLKKQNNQSSENLANTGSTKNQPNITKDTDQLKALTTPNKAQLPPYNISQEKLAQEVHTVGGGFYSARAANLLSVSALNQASPANIPSDLTAPHVPLFNPHAESPSIRKTPGIDHKCSKPITRDLKQGKSSSQIPTTPTVKASSGTGAAISRGNILNPCLDNVRRIGAPGSPGSIGLNNGKGNSFRVPMKRNTDGGVNRPSNGSHRIPLEPLNANSPTADIDHKRQKLHG